MLNIIENSIDKLYEIARDKYQKLPVWFKKVLRILLIFTSAIFLLLLIYNLDKIPFELI
jgi:hypothetical protein